RAQSAPESVTELREALVARATAYRRGVARPEPVARTGS
ncbi:MAG: hypothetical protein QOH37_3818, partial [Nocardioidaceae bacterium]|nr:hypothetical protein [Nocardioidaceae bacterium]